MLIGGDGDRGRSRSWSAAARSCAPTPSSTRCSSREAVFLFQNLVLVAMVFVIFWVTFFPLISEAVTGTKVSVGPPAFRPFIVPLALMLVLLSGIGPIIAWRRVTVANLRRNFTLPALRRRRRARGAGDFHRRRLASVRADHVRARGVRRGDRRPGAVARYCARRAMTRDPVPVAFVQLIRRNRRRYGGYIVHAGLAVLLIGVAGVVVVPALAGHRPAAGPAGACRRLHDHLRQADRLRDVRLPRRAREGLASAPC